MANSWGCWTGEIKIRIKPGDDAMSPNLDRITFDPKIMTGKACIRGMRVPVSLVVNLLANGKTTAEIIEDYPYLEPEDIRQLFRSAMNIIGCGL